jgi:hypothetical protein
MTQVPTQDQIEEDVFNMNHGLGDIDNGYKGVAAAGHGGISQLSQQAAGSLELSQLGGGLSQLGTGLGQLDVGLPQLPTIFTSNRIPVHPATNPLGATITTKPPPARGTRQPLVAVPQIVQASFDQKL